MSAFKTCSSLLLLALLLVAAHGTSDAPDIAAAKKNASSNAASFSGNDHNAMDLDLLRGIYYGELSIDPQLRVLLSDSEFRPVLDSFVNFWTAMWNRTGGIHVIEGIVITDDEEINNGSSSRPYLVQLQKLQAQILADAEASRSVNLTVLQSLRDEDDVVVFFEVGKGMVEVGHKLNVVDGLVKKMIEGVGDVEAAAQDRMDQMGHDEDDMEDEEDDDEDNGDLVRALMQKVGVLEKENEALQTTLVKLAHGEL